MGIRKEEKKNLNQLKLLMSVFKLAQTLLNTYKASHIQVEMTVSVPIWISKKTEEVYENKCI